MIATVAGAVSLLWLVVALAVARGDLLEARDHGSAPVAALAQADTAALQARADESLTLIDAGGDDSFQADFLAVEHRLGPGPGTLLGDAASAAQGTPGARPRRRPRPPRPPGTPRTGRCGPSMTTAGTARRCSWSRGRARSFRHAVPRSSTRSLDRAIAADQAVFRSRAVAARDAFTGLEAGVIVLALVMAAGCARGLSRRIAEYR